VRYHPLTKDFFRTIFNNEGKCWPEFYKYIKGVKDIRKIFLPSKTVIGNPS